MNENKQGIIEVVINDMQQRIDERIENLCAIYDNKGIAPMLGTLITLDSAFSAHIKMIITLAEDESEAKSALLMLSAIQSSAFAKITRNTMEMIHIPDDKQEQLIKDMLGVIDVRKKCEDEIEAVLNHKGKLQ